VPASELQPDELKRILRSKIQDGVPAAPEDYISSLVALGLVDPAPRCSTGWSTSTPRR
jgi:hypothetical protein